MHQSTDLSCMFSHGREVRGVREHSVYAAFQFCSFNVVAELSQQFVGDGQIRWSKCTDRHWSYGRPWRRQGQPGDDLLAPCSPGIVRERVYEQPRFTVDSRRHKRAAVPVAEISGSLTVRLNHKGLSLKFRPARMTLTVSP